MPLGRVSGNRVATLYELQNLTTQLNRIEYQVRDTNKRLFALVLWVVFGALFAGIMAPLTLAIAL